MEKVSYETKSFLTLVAAIIVLIGAISAGWLISNSRQEIKHQLIDYNDSSYGDFYVISEKRTGKENIKILTIRDDEYDEYVIVLDTDTGDIEAITKY